MDLVFADYRPSPCVVAGPIAAKLDVAKQAFSAAPRVAISLRF
jgi:hypothetical protein